MSLDKHVINSIETSSVAVGNRFLLAVSGGKDSMTLLSVFHELGLPIVVAHMNYGLRSEDADLDEVLVREECEKKAIEVMVKRVDTKSFCQEHGYSTQEGARVLRYKWFEELMKELSLDWVVTAHHEEDNKETFIQNLKRGSGLRGLKSMRVVHEYKFKPMLSASREEIDGYATTNGVIYREDASNNKNHYQRNLVRNKLLPSLEDQLPGFGKGITSSIQQMQLDYDFMAEMLDQEANLNLIEEKGAWKLLAYKRLHPRLVFHVLEKFGFNFVQATDILKASSSGKKIMNEKYTAEVGQETLFIYPKKTYGSRTEYEVKDLGIHEVNGVRIQITVSERPASFSADKNVAFMDAERLTWPLSVRSFQQGDKIIPIGMKGKKKLSDYFIDEKIPVHLRQDKQVVISNGEIIWVVGELVSELVKLTSKTKKVLKLETLS